MNDVLKFGKKLFTASVVGVTIAWSMGLAALVSPAVAQAATCPELEAGDLFKAPNASAVYYLTAGMERAYFPHEDVFKSWNLSFSDVKTVSGECLFAYPVATPAGINYRPGSRLIKLTDAPAVFAIGPGNKITQIGSEAVAAALYGSAWAKTVRDVSPFHWSNYADTRATWSESKPHDGMLVKKASESTVYLVQSGSLVKVDGTVATSGDVRTVSDSVFATLSVGSGTVTANSVYENPTQVDGSAPAPTTGALTVSLASNTSASRVVPMGAQGVDYLAFTVRAGSSAGTLEQVTLKRAGIGSRNDFSKVYIYHNGVRVDNGRSLNTDDEATFNVNTNISANSTETFWVKADMNTDGAGSTSGDQNYFEISTASEVDATGSVGGSFPVRGNAISLGAQDIGTVTTTGRGSDTNAKIGQNSVVVSEFDVEASAADDVEVTGITLKQKGTAPASVLKNVKLMHGGTLVASGVVTGDWVKFDFTQKVTIEAGDTERFKVYADLGIADTNDTVELVLDETSDLMAYSVDFPGSLAGVNNNLQSTGSDDALIVTLQGGKINVDIEGTNEDVRPDQNDVVFGTFTILATAEDIDVDEMKFVVMRPNSAACLEDLRLRDKNGKGSYSLDYDGTCATGTANATTTAENMILTQGTTYEFEIVGDVASGAVNGDQYYFTWAASDVDAEGVSSDNTIASGDFSTSNLTGPTMSVSPSSLTVRSTALSDETVVAGTDNVLLYRGTLEAGSTSDVTLTSLEFREGSNDSDLWQSLVDDMKLYIAPVGETVDTATDLVDNTSDLDDEIALFNGFNYVVKAGSSNKVNFEVYGNITDGSATGAVELQAVDADAEDEDGETVNPINASGSTLDDSSNAVVSSRVLTVSGSGSLTAVIDTNYTGLRNDFYVLAGTQKQLAGRIQLRATNEDVKLKDLVIFATSTDQGGGDTVSVLNSTFDSITLYEDAAMTKPLASDDFSGGTAGDGVTTTLEDINYVIPRDTTKYLYIGINVNSIGNGDNATATSSVDLKLQARDTNTTAEGMSSKTDLSASSITVTETLTNKMTVLGAQVTNVTTNFASGDLVGGEQTFFTFSVTANAGSNTDVSGDALDVLLTSVKLQLATDAASVTGTKLCRVSTGNCINLTTTSPWTSPGVLETPGGAGSVLFSNFTNVDDRRVNNGETVQYEVRGTFSGVTDKFAQGSLQDVNSSGLVWGYDLDNNNVVDINASFSDLKKMEPRWSGYPDVVGGTLN